MPTSCGDCKAFVCYRQWAGDIGDCFCGITKSDAKAKEKNADCPLVPVPRHGRVIDADALTGQMERNLWAIEDKAEKELGFDETLRRGMQYGHAVCLNAVNDATVIFVPQIVHCCECEYNNHCLTQEFVEDASKIPFDKNTWFCADAKAAPTIIPAEEGE